MTEVFMDPTTGKTKIILDAFEDKTIADILTLASQKVAEKFWEANQDKIMAKMDLTGLANLIAIHASEALTKK